MDYSLKSCMTAWGAQNHKVREVLVDRLTNLPDELLIQILSLLPTKDAAATCVLSKRLRRVFPLITSLDFDVSPVSLCLKRPYAVELFPTFVSFVDTVLKSYKSQYLTSFKLRFSRTHIYSYRSHWCLSNCLPDFEFAHLNAWISFPLTSCGLRELDLCIRVKEPGDSQLPPAIFMCETLEVLKLEANLGLDQVIALPSYRLPLLKLLCLREFFVSDDDFLPRLVSSCPLLEDLTYVVSTNHVHHTSICSTSLRKLLLFMLKTTEAAEQDNSDLVLIHAPNLEYLQYMDNVAYNYSIPLMPCLVKADLIIEDVLIQEDIPVSFEKLISLIRPLSCVKHLSLYGRIMRCFMEVNDYAGEKFLKDQLPMFPNLKHLELDFGFLFIYWDKLLLPILACSPFLETLVFPWGLMAYYNVVCTDGGGMHGPPQDDYGYEKELLELELKYFRTTEAIPSCIRNHMKRIVIKEYYGVLQREVEIIKFFLRHALVLEELIICRTKRTDAHISDQDQLLVEKTMKNLPRASANCSIQVL